MNKKFPIDPIPGAFAVDLSKVNSRTNKLTTLLKLALMSTVTVTTSNEQGSFATARTFKKPTPPTPPGSKHYGSKKKKS